MSHPRLFHLSVAILFVLAAFAIRAASLDAQSLWRDEVDALCYAYEFPQLVAQAVAPETTADLVTPCACPPLPISSAASPNESVPQRLARTAGGMIRQNGPLYFFLLRGWVAVTGTSEYAMRFFSLIFGVLGVSLSYALGHRLFDRQVGLAAALLLATSSYLTWYSQEVKMYTLISALAMAAIYALRRAVEGGGWYWWTVQVVATSLAFYSHILAALLIPVQVLLYLTWWPQARRQWVGATISLVCLTLPYLPLVVWQAQQVFQARETGFYPYSLSEMVAILLNGWSLGIINRGWPWGTVLMGTLAMWGLVSPLIMAIAQIDRQASDADHSLPADTSPPTTHPATLTKAGEKGNRLALICWLVIPLLAVWFISLRQPLFTDRYIIWTAPAFYLLVSVGLASIERSVSWGRWISVTLVGIILVFNILNLQHQATQRTKSDFRAAAAHVAERYSPDELIIFQIPHGRYTFDYYFPDDGQYAWDEGLYTNHRRPDGSYMMNEQDAAHRMEAMTARYSALWLIATETTMWDDRGLVHAWLEANAEPVDEAHFVRVDVYRYAK
jgi:mannosyltransferase